MTPSSPVAEMLPRRDIDTSLSTESKIIIISLPYTISNDVVKTQIAKKSLKKSLVITTLCTTN